MVSILTLSLFCAVAAPEIDDLERRTVAYRRQIHRGEVEFSIELHVMRENGAWVKANNCQRNIAFEGDRNRNDTHWIVYGDDVVDKSRVVQCRNCGPERSFISWISHDPPRVNTCVSVQPVADTEGNLLYTPIDPRMAGMSIYGISNSVRYTLTSFLPADAKRPDLQMEEVAIQGRPCQRISWRSTEGTDLRVWIDPERGPSIVRLQEAAAPPGQTSALTEVELQRHEATGLWFPSKIVDTQWDGPKKTYEAVTLVRVKSLNQPLDAKTFTMAGLDIPKGKCIRVEDKPGNLIWDGTKAVPTEAPPRRARELAKLDQAASRWSWKSSLLIANAVLLAGFGALALRKYLGSS